MTAHQQYLDIRQHERAADALAKLMRAGKKDTPRPSSSAPAVGLNSPELLVMALGRAAGTRTGAPQLRQFVSEPAAPASADPIVPDPAIDPSQGRSNNGRASGPDLMLQQLIAVVGR